MECGKEYGMDQKSIKSHSGRPKDEMSRKLGQTWGVTLGRVVYTIVDHVSSLQHYLSPELNP